MTEVKAVDAGLAGLEVGAVIQMQSDGGSPGLPMTAASWLYQVGVVGARRAPLETCRITGAFSRGRPR